MTIIIVSRHRVARVTNQDSSINNQKMLNQLNKSAKMYKSTAKQALLLNSIVIYLINFRPPVDGLAIEKSQASQQSIEQTNVLTKTPSPLPQATQEIRSDTRRPIWNLAHMVNSIKELDYRLGKGANAIEVDVTFGRDGDPLFTYHGPPCDCWRHCHQQEDFNEYLRYVREIAIEQQDGVGKNLSLLFLDLKLDYLDHKAKARAGIELANSVMSNLFIGSLSNESLAEDAMTTPNVTVGTSKQLERPFRLILSVNHVTDVELINNFLHQLEQNNSSHLISRIGFDVGMNDDLQQIETMWKRFGNTLNLWQGDGYTNCFSPFYNLERLSKAILKRDSELGYPRKVYQWTIDLHDRMREALLLGVDAVMTNHPERLLTVLQEPEIAHNYRLATAEDDPFKKITKRASARSSESARYQRSASPTGGGFFGSIIDVVTSWLAYIREIPFFSLPTTSRFMPKVKRHKEASMVISKLSSSPENNLAARSSNETTVSTTNATATTISDGRTSISDAVDQAIVVGGGGEQVSQPYEGPKWYTSFVSNVLVSMMKIILPAQS